MTPLVTRRLLLVPADDVPDDVGLARGWPTDEAALALARLDAEVWLVVDGERRTVIGHVGVRRRGADAELDYSVVRVEQGRGVASEAVRAVVTSLSAEGAVRRILAVVSPGNEPSRRLLLGLGFAPETSSPTDDVLVLPAG